MVRGAGGGGGGGGGGGRRFCGVGFKVQGLGFRVPSWKPGLGLGGSGLSLQTNVAFTFPILSGQVHEVAH